MNQPAINDLLYRMADDLLILGHRNSEWTGLGPLLEEDIAFSSMAQDKVGQSLAFYRLLHENGEKDPDTLAFRRGSEAFHNCQLVELPNHEYDLSLIRHLMYDISDHLRFEMLAGSSYIPLANLARKLKGEIKYHVMHAQAIVSRLGNGTEESVTRLQQSLDYLYPYALGIFEPSRYEDQIIREGIFEGEAALCEKWSETLGEFILNTRLRLPEGRIEPVYGGRSGKHSEHLQPLLDEMSEVINIDPEAEW